MCLPSSSPSCSQAWFEAVSAASYFFDSNTSGTGPLLPSALDAVMSASGDETDWCRMMSSRPSLDGARQIAHRLAPVFNAGAATGDRGLIARIIAGEHRASFITRSRAPDAAQRFFNGALQSRGPCSLRFLAALGPGSAQQRCTLQRVRDTRFRRVAALQSLIASQRVRAKRGPMTGSAKQSRFVPRIDSGLLRRKCSSQ